MNIYANNDIESYSKKGTSIIKVWFFFASENLHKNFNETR